MAVTNIKNSTALVLSYKVGVSEKGEDIIKSQKFSSVKDSATNEELFTLSGAMASLFPHGIFDIRKLEDYSIVEE